MIAKRIDDTKGLGEQRKGKNTIKCGSYEFRERCHLELRTL